MKYALIIGNTQYKDPKLAQLKAPAVDSQSLARVLSDARIGSFDKVIPLVNKTEFQVTRAISTFLAEKKPDDLVLVYFSGHGILDDRGRLFLALKDTQTNLLKSTAIASSFIADEMDSCRSKRQILILDCCHSGAFGRGVKGENQKAITETTFEGNGFGRVVLTASASTQYALEGNQVIEQSELSLFTHFLLEGLETGSADLNNDGYISLDEWYDYTYTRVLTSTPRQVPHKWSYHQQGDLIIAQNPFRKKRQVEMPEDLLRLLESPYSSVRQVAVKELGALLGSRDSDLAELARMTLEKLTEDDSRTVSQTAREQLAAAARPAEKSIYRPEVERQSLGQVTGEGRGLEKTTKERSVPALGDRRIPLAKIWKELERKSFHRLPGRPSSYFRIGGIIFIALVIVWAGAQVLPQLFSPVATRTPSVTSPPVSTGTASITTPSHTQTMELTPQATETQEFVSLPLPESTLSDAFEEVIEDVIVDDHGVEMRLVSVDGSQFYMDTYEVTNALYNDCVDADICQASGAFSLSRETIRANNPVVFVNRAMAQTYCQWREARLPTESEWIQAARGDTDYMYPWGNTIDCTYANYDYTCAGTTVPVGSYEEGKSVFGIYDLIGNVSEWTDTFPKGGSWASSINRSTIDYPFHGVSAGTSTDRIGFRCAASVP